MRREKIKTWTNPDHPCERRKDSGRNILKKGA
jgi:hypothetical protein